MEQLSSHSEDASQPSREGGWSDFPPFVGDRPEQPRRPTEMKDLEEIHDCELDIIAKNSDVLGYNIDSKLIIWPERHKQAAGIKGKCIGEDGEYDDARVTATAREFSAMLGEEITPERFVTAIEEELSKDKLLDDTLDKLPEGIRFRITPHAPQSAFSTVNSERIKNEAGESRFRIDGDVMSQVEKIRKKAKDSELLVVINQLHIGEDGKPTSNIPEDATDYIALCKSFVEQSGYSKQSGKGLALELGNECNMSHESNGPLFKTEAFAETVDPEAYATFYFETAKALKASFPDIKLSLTGTAFYDYDFTKQVIDRIQAMKDADESLKDTKLIDIISFHPYRKTVESPTPFMGNGKELSVSEIRKRAEEYWGSITEEERKNTRETILARLTDDEKALADDLSDEEKEGIIAYKAYASFDHQLDTLREIADEIGAEVTVGEVSFYSGDWGASVDENEQERNASHGRERGYTSLLWPGEQIVKHENPERRKAESNQ